MEKTACSEVLREIARGDVDLDKISEIMRSSDLLIRQFQNEIEGLHRAGEQLELDLEEEKRACDDLVRRLKALHEENRLARGVFRNEIEGRRALIGVQMTLDLEAMDMAALIREREKSQEDLGKALGAEAGIRIS
ncbi:MAG TPA: hypothetical protein VF398_02835 [bacterium]|jgi:hypothetical protein